MNEAQRHIYFVSYNLSYIWNISACISDLKFLLINKNFGEWRLLLRHKIIFCICRINYNLNCNSITQINDI